MKNALELKRRWPDARIVVFYRDMRTYGFREAAYREAREKGVLFIRYEAEQPPQLLDAGGKLRLKVREPSLGRDLVLEPDLVVLAAPAVPRADRGELSELLRVPLNADGFFLEAHMKLRPVDFASEGLFLCGAAHAPKFISETISQATAVAGRAASILSRKKMPVGGQIAWVDPDQCISCMTCVHVCPYMAPQVGANNKAEVQGAVCMGCGSCSAECPAKAITLRHFMDAQILAAVNSLLETDVEKPRASPFIPKRSAWPRRAGVRTFMDQEPLILAFCCHYCAYAAADLAGSMRLQYPQNVRVLRLPCTGKIEVNYLLAAFERGVDGVIVAGCLEGGCHFLEGNLRARRRVARAKQLLGEIGLEPERLEMFNLSSAEGGRFAEIVTTMVQRLEQLGPSPLRTDARQIEQSLETMSRQAETALAGETNHDCCRS